MSIQVSVSINEATKQKIDKVYQAIGMSPSNAISMFVSSVYYNGIPFNPVAQPSKHPKMTMEEAMAVCKGSSR
jgi:addiction module RelB/DinJ family antitoxin